MNKTSVILSQIYFENWPNDLPFSIQQITDLSRKNRKVERQYAESYSVEYIYSGEMIVNENGVGTIAQAGDTILFRRHSTHSYRDVKNKDVHTIHTTFCGSMCDLLYEHYGLSSKKVYKGIDVSKSLKSMLEFSQKNKSTDEKMAYCAGVISEIFYKLYLSLEQEKIKPDGTASFVKVVLDRHIERFSTNEELADFFNCSVSSLTRNFKKKYGITPIEYQHRKKIEAAKKLLLEDTLSVKEIASKLGFCDATYFTAYFRKHIGVSPKKYLKAQKNEKE